MNWKRLLALLGFCVLCAPAFAEDLGTLSRQLVQLLSADENNKSPEWFKPGANGRIYDGEDYADYSKVSFIVIKKKITGAYPNEFPYWEVVAVCDECVWHNSMKKMESSRGYSAGTGFGFYSEDIAKQFKEHLERYRVAASKLKVER